jgi:hypothetical protein
MNSDEVTDGWFLAIRYREGKGAVERAKQLPGKVKAVGQSKDLNLRYGLFDASPKESASKL